MRTIEKLPRPAVELLKWYISVTPVEHNITVDAGNSKGTFLLTEPAEVDHFHWNLQTERPILEDFVMELEPNDVLYDVGANVGLYACCAGPIVDTVFAFEPQKKNAQRCSRNLTRNSVDFYVSQSALGEDVDRGLFVPDDRGMSPGAGQGHVTLSDDDGNQGTEHSIKITTGDTFANKYDSAKPTVVKIDTEGAEKEVISGFKETLRESVRLVYCEVHLDAQPASEIESMLSDLGFTTEVLHDRDETTFLKGVNESKTS